MNNLLDLAGIGVGPANLSLAALLTPVADWRSQFFERQAEFKWHPGMMLAGTHMQTSFLKDLVTPVDPSNPYSFLAYLVKQGRFYRFVNAEFPRAPRREFANYLRWVAEQLPNLHFNAGISEVRLDDAGFTLQGDGLTVRSRHVVVGTGWTPFVPNWAEHHLGASCWHSHHHVGNGVSVAGKRVAIIGGGQSGAEIFLELMAGKRGQAESIVWISRRPGLDALDETAFTNEYFTPDYVSQLHRLPPMRKLPVVKSHKLTGDGVSPATLLELSKYLYTADFLTPNPTAYRILPNREVYIMERSADALRLYMRNGFDNRTEDAVVDKVIFATGYQYQLPACLSVLKPRLDLDGDGFPKLADDYTVPWDGPGQHRIYLQNAGRNSHGVADAQLSLAAWRSAIIVNSVLGETYYPVQSQCSPITWSAEPAVMPVADAHEGCSAPAAARPGR